MTTNSTNNERIIGGRPASAPIPWQVHLLEMGDGICGGTIIDRRTILTAAHCFYDDNGVLNTTAAIYALSVGIVERDHTDNSPITLESITTHEGFDLIESNHDIAILKLAKPLSFNEHIGPLCLPNKSYDPKEGTECFVSGWGEEKPIPIVRGKLLVCTNKSRLK